MCKHDAVDYEEAIVKYLTIAPIESYFLKAVYCISMNSLPKY
jgi:hypothetical protein